MNKRTNVMPIRVYVSDTEFQRFVSSHHYFKWFGWARTEYYRQYCGLTVDDDGTPRLAGQHLVIVMVNTNCTLHSSGRFNDELELITSIDNVGNHSLTFNHELRNLTQENALVAEAQATMVFVDPETKKKTYVPLCLRGELERSD